MDQLFDAVAKFGASEKLEGDAWGALVKACYGIADVATALKEVEQQWKERTKVPLPGRYRSAKSVILAARAAGVDLLDADLKTKGKTAVEREVRGLKETVTVHPGDAIVAALKNITAILANCPTEAERVACKSILIAYLEELK